MLAKTHIISAETIAIPLLYLIAPNQDIFIEYLPIVSGSIAFGAIFPDIDEPRSKIGMKLAPISAVVSALFRHRTVTHSLVIWGALFLITLSLWLLTTIEPMLLIGFTCFFGGCFLHILGDLMTTAPVRGALFPISQKIFWIVPSFMRFAVGSPKEYICLGLFALLLCWFCAEFAGIAGIADIVGGDMAKGINIKGF